MQFTIEPTTSKRKLTKYVMEMIEMELKKCSPDYELTLDIKVIEDHSKPIPQIMNKKKWDKMRNTELK